MTTTVARAEPSVAGVGDYFELMKPRVMSLVVFTVLVGLVAPLFAMLLVDSMAGGHPPWGHLPAGA